MRAFAPAISQRGAAAKLSCLFLPELQPQHSFSVCMSDVGSDMRNQDLEGRDISATDEDDTDEDGIQGDLSAVPVPLNVCPWWRWCVSHLRTDSRPTHHCSPSWPLGMKLTSPVEIGAPLHEMTSAHCH